MSARDPIASTTIARLYIAQGHLRKAARMLDALLDQDADDGAALHLRTRLRAMQAPTLTASVDDTALEIGWDAVPQGPDEPQRHAVIVSYLAAGTLPQVHVTSVPCKEAADACTFDRPQQPGSAVVSLGYVGESGWVAEAVTSPLVWSSAPEDA
ncbi:MAG: tetratricopeptide repeat protein [Myxococcota bacterium]